MKTSTVRIFSAAILLVVAGVGFGIAQASGTHTDRPVLSFEDQVALEHGDSSSPYVESRPVLGFEDPADGIQLATAGQEFVPEDNWSGTDWQARGPVETGAIPVTASEESWMKDYGND